MVIIIDTRQQVNKHNHKDEYFESKGISVVRSKLPYGDYALMPTVSVDTKKDIYELAQDIDQDHERFRSELINARDHGCKLYILVENEHHVTSLSNLVHWSEPDGHLAMRKKKSGNSKARRIEGKRLARACMTMQERYGAEFLFCPPEESGRMIVELLERREDGEFDT